MTGLNKKKFMRLENEVLVMRENKALVEADVEKQMKLTKILLVKVLVVNKTRPKGLMYQILLRMRIPIYLIKALEILEDLDKILTRKPESV